VKKAKTKADLEASLIREAMTLLSKRGASKGGKARWKGKTKAERTAYAKYLVDCRKKRKA
jgi:hypothetical protein